MDDSNDTIIITGIGSNVTGPEFIKMFSKLGEIKTHQETGQRLAEMKWVRNKKEKEGIVSYSNPVSAEKALLEFKGKRDLYVKTPENHFYGRSPQGSFKVPSEYGNLAWWLWKEEGLRNDGGGRGGKGGESHSTGFLSWFGLGSKPGHDGQPGSSDGQGGKGGDAAHKY